MAEQHSIKIAVVFISNKKYSSRISDIGVKLLW